MWEFQSNLTKPGSGFSLWILIPDRNVYTYLRCFWVFGIRQPLQITTCKRGHSQHISIQRHDEHSKTYLESELCLIFSCERRTKRKSTTEQWREKKDETTWIAWFCDMPTVINIKDNNNDHHPQTIHHDGLTLAAPNTAKPVRRICRSGLSSGQNWCRVNLQRRAPRLKGAEQKSPQGQWSIQWGLILLLEERRKTRLIWHLDNVLKLLRHGSVPIIYFHFRYNTDTNISTLNIIWYRYQYAAADTCLHDLFWGALENLHQVILL